MLQAAPGAVIVLTAVDRGDKELTRGVQAPKKIELKVGCSVRSRKNTYGAGGNLLYANGSIGKVLRYESNSKRLMVRWPLGDYAMYPCEYTRIRPVELVHPATGRKHIVEKKFSRMQHPLRLAYAMTHHASQGATLKGAIDIDFASGHINEQTGEWDRMRGLVRQTQRHIP